MATWRTTFASHEILVTAVNALRLAEPMRRITGFAVCEAEVIRHPDEIGDGVGAHLPHGLPAMDLYGDFTEADLGSDLFVEEPSRHERHHLAFAWRKCGKTFLKIDFRRLLKQAGAIDFKCLPDCIEKILLPERL